MRRVLDHAFSSKAFLEQQPVLESYINRLMQSLKDQVNGPAKGKVDLVTWFNWTTFDIVGDFSFGAPFDCLKEQRNHPWLDTIFGNLKIVTIVGVSSRFVLFRKLLPYLVPRKAKEQMRLHRAYLDEKITKRIELGTTRPDFITPMLKNNNNGKGLTPAEIRANMGLMIVAGSESVVTVTCGAIYYMLKNPSTMRKLVDEIRSAFESESDINSKTVAGLKYLTAIINESLRLYPSTPGLPACRVPLEGSTVSGYWVAGDVSDDCQRIKSSTVK
jgi:cytochrome P450